MERKELERVIHEALVEIEGEDEDDHQDDVDNPYVATYKKIKDDFPKLATYLHELKEFAKDEIAKSKFEEGMHPWHEPFTGLNRAEGVLEKFAEKVDWYVEVTKENIIKEREFQELLSKGIVKTIRMKQPAVDPDVLLEFWSMLQQATVSRSYQAAGAALFYLDLSVETSWNYPFPGFDLEYIFNRAKSLIY